MHTYSHDDATVFYDKNIKRTGERFTMEIREYRRKSRAMVYFFRGLVLVVLLLISFLMGCGGVYLYERFFKEETSPAYSDKAELTNDSENNTIVSGGNENGNNILTVTKEPDSITGNPIDGHVDDSEICVVLDAGHGGTDQGTCNGNILEKDINLLVVLRIKDILEQQGIKVILTRDSDSNIGLEERAELANEMSADLFISIHCNYYEDSSDISGLECYYNPDSSKGKIYAESIISACENSERINVRNAKPEDFSVLRNTMMPAVLIEIGFMSNYTELINLTDNNYQQHLAEKIADGILAELT